MMLKNILRAILILGVVNVARCQYGIPDDDDVPVRAAIPSPPIARVQETVRTLPQVASSRIVRDDYAAPVRAAVLADIPTTRVEIREESRHYDTPAIAVRAKPAIVSTYAAPAPVVERVEIRESLPAYTPSIRVTPVVVKEDAYSYSTPLIRKEVVPIVKYIMQDDNYGSFHLETLTGDGSASTKIGQLRNLGDLEGPVQVMSGSYSYIGDDGKNYSVDWVADENGFRAAGDHLPTPP